MQVSLANWQDFVLGFNLEMQVSLANWQDFVLGFNLEMQVSLANFSSVIRTWATCSSWPPDSRPVLKRKAKTTFKLLKPELAKKDRLRNSAFFKLRKH